MSLNQYAKECHQAALKWWRDPVTGEPIERNKGELIALIHSELSEMLEGVRKGIPDDKLSQYPMEHVEAVDVFIRLADYAGAYGIDLDAIYRAKLDYNAHREDHKPENRVKDGGKKF
jgi:hypothetical protein